MTETAPLTALPDSPVPPGGGAEWFEGQGGARLRAALFRPEGRPRGSVILSTGRTEAIEKYFEVVCDLQARGFVVLVNEWRGQGLSHRDLPDRRKGHARGVEPFLADYHALLVAFEARLPKPWIAAGHSMGGCLTLTALARGQARRFAGAVLCAPMLGLRLPRFARLLVGVRMLAGGAEGWAQPPGDPAAESFEGNVLTQDPVRYRRNKDLLRANPDLALSSPTWGWLDFALKTMDWLSRRENLANAILPVVIVSAASDRLVDVAAQSVIAGLLPDGRLVTVEGAEHEILMETDPLRTQFWTAFDDLADQVAPRYA
ncbi:alpha/beta fold hydrolase [Phenylobacterium sp.]|jgi:lysophospholipase|uniref:alpha/beta fold hydrolase n=1 Tax=Phenylobacterium sp. TaxID=1871053 RepID=UPI0025E49906|nr:alpha/beta hydrolase [Phenylobacterium sp.]MCA3720217.1 alpha/beta hydrolase [Phenylobacterium sp.]